MTKDWPKGTLGDTDRAHFLCHCAFQYPSMDALKTRRYFALSTIAMTSVLIAQAGSSDPMLTCLDACLDAHPQARGALKLPPPPDVLPVLAPAIFL